MAKTLYPNYVQDVPSGNIFHNYYFVGGGTEGKFPVNQRGNTSWNADGYMFDRWIIDVGNAGTAALEAAGLRLHTEVNAMILSQRIEYIDDTRTYTASILADGVLHVATGSFPAKGGANATWTSKSGNAVISAANPSEGFPEVFFNFPKSSASRLVIAAGLNPGEEQTIFVETSGGGYLINEVPDYSNETETCQRYYIQLTESATATIVHNDRVNPNFFLCREMRGVPVVSYYSDMTIYVDGLSMIISNGKITVERVVNSGNQVQVNFVKNTSTEKIAQCGIWNGNIAFSSEL